MLSTHHNLFYIDGQWREPASAQRIDVVNPATEQIVAQVAAGTQADVDAAVSAARRAFTTYSQSSAQERMALLDRIVVAYQERVEDIAQAITLEMGSPIRFSRQVQVTRPLMQFKLARDVLRNYAFETELCGAQIRREPIGVCGLITPWNWPLGQVASKLASALAAGCTVVLKPSELSPLSALLLAEVLDQAGVPPGVFNLVNGDGPTVGRAITTHPDVDMVSFTGSTRAGVLIAQDAAASIKRVAQELGGKSPNLIFPSADLERAVTQGVLRCFMNSGQSCQGPTRMLVHRSQLEQVEALVSQASASIKVGDPGDSSVDMGPLANRNQFEKVQAMIQQGLDEGAHLVCGGLGMPNGVTQGFFARPTVFSRVQSSMHIAQEEIFGPVLVVLTYDDEEEAIAIANDSRYGLAAYIQSNDAAQVQRVAARLRAGRVYVNGADALPGVPFGGYKGSGNGREQGVFGLEEYLEVKAVIC